MHRRVCVCACVRVPPKRPRGGFGVWFVQFLSKEKKIMSAKKDIGDVENQWLTQYCRKKLESNNYNYFLFGHSHIPVELELNSESKYINLGDWITHFTYAEFDGNELTLKTYEG